MVNVIRIGSEQVRTGPWRGDRSVAFLAPSPRDPAPSGDFIRQCLDVLTRQGFSKVVTGALSPLEQTGFLAAGFLVEERLHLLAHDLADIPETPAAPVHLRRARNADRAAVLAVDHAAFPPFWRLDAQGLQEAVDATPRARFRVAAAADGGGVSGYAVFGRAGTRGYVQRLGVDPARHGLGIGSALMVDGMRWLKRRGVQRAVVNTQTTNEVALTLYQRLGFRLEPVGLSVLTTELPA